MTELSQPPIAPKKEHSITYHNKEYKDPYFWLREKESTEVLDYLKAENEYFEKNMETHALLVEELYQEFVQRKKEDDESVPEKYGDHYYYYRIEKGKNYRIYCRKKTIDSPEEIILDLNVLGEGKNFVSLGSYDISKDNNFLAYTIDFSGYENYQLFIKNLTTNEINELKIIDLDGSIYWGLDNSTIYYCKRDKIHRSSYNYRGTFDFSKNESINEELLYFESDEIYYTYMSKTKDDKYIMITSKSSETTEVRFIDLQTQELRLFDERNFSILYFLYYREGYFYILTNEEAINFKVMRVKAQQTEFMDKSNWETFVAGEEPIKIDRLEMFEKFIVLYIRRNGLKNVKIYIEEGKQWHDVSFPEPVFTINNRSSPSNNEYKSDKVRFFFESLKTPHTVYDYNVFTRKLELLKQDEIFGGFKAENYLTERLFVKATDGTEIPVSIMYQKSCKRNSSNPAFLYGYGSYGISMEPSFNPYMLSLIDRGYVFVIAHIRGGGEMGRKWYLDGKYLKKKNTFTDFINVAEFLIAEKYTNPSKLTISGGSAGGLLMGAVVNMRPDLFKVVKMNVPFVDVINTMMDASIPLTTFEYEEWGNPNEQEYFDYMHSYSPYDNVKAQNYPHIIVTAGLNDPRVHYWEPAKFVSKLRSLKTDTNDLYFKINMGAGHAGASGKYTFLKDMAFEYVFILTHI